MVGRRHALAALGVGLAGSQAGHLLTFQLVFGSAAQHLQSTGAHAYFPFLAKTALGAAAAVLLAGMFVIGLARVVSGQSRVKKGSKNSFVQLVALLFTIQLTCFISQEVAEATIAGTGVASAASLLLWGTLGQLPVAAVAAVGLRWLLTNFDSAVDELRAVLTAVRTPLIPTLVTVQPWPAPAGAFLISRLAPLRNKRGPPTS
jgi:hypothetical protein